ncbi:hypothetical protein SAMN02745121_05351 [Nannocystis exedens]|uniref:Uncharacterized protein n=1 Tax=Nannocystis exedens TaxID=54 RepID=A0A1I2CZ67_9BACT|nr:hypothetical protein NAEX_01692 [Nannocystis exedens]SFE73566.1 hypothetical protein SAMN02745121_05351 [Nannocystis exedens]
MLEVSNITRGHLAVALEPVDCAALVREVVAGLAEELARARCEVRPIGAAAMRTHASSSWASPTGGIATADAGSGGGLPSSCGAGPQPLAADSSRLVKTARPHRCGRMGIRPRVSRNEAPVATEPPPCGPENIAARGEIRDLRGSPTRRAYHGQGRSVLQRKLSSHVSGSANSCHCTQRLPRSGPSYRQWKNHLLWVGTHR